MSAISVVLAHKQGMATEKRPRLTRAVIDGLDTVHSDAYAMLAERTGWDENHETDENELLALEYLVALIKWYYSNSNQTTTFGSRT